MQGHFGCPLGFGKLLCIFKINAKLDNMKIICGDNEVTAKDNVKYLGVGLDQSLGGKYIAESI